MTLLFLNSLLLGYFELVTRCIVKNVFWVLYIIVICLYCIGALDVFYMQQPSNRRLLPLTS